MATQSVAPDVLFAQKASAVAKCAGMDPRSMDLERFRSLAPVIFCKAYSTIYKETLPLEVNEEPEECMQYVIEGLLDKTNVGALTLITGSDVCSGSHRSIGVLVGCLFAEGQRMWMQKQEAKKRAEAAKNNAAGVPKSNRPLSAAPSRGARQKNSRTSPSKGNTGLEYMVDGGAGDDEGGYADDFSDVADEQNQPPAGPPNVPRKKRSAKKSRKDRKLNTSADGDSDSGVGLEDGLSPSRPPRAGTDDEPEAGAQDVKALMKRVAYLENKLKAKKSARTGSPKRVKKKKITSNIGHSSDDKNGTKSQQQLPSPSSITDIGKAQRVGRPHSAPSGSDLRNQASQASDKESTSSVPKSPERHAPDAAGGPNSHFTYDMKSGRRILMTEAEYVAREKRRELYLLSGPKGGSVHPGADSTQVGEMWKPESASLLPKPPSAPQSPPREPTEARWPGPSTGRSTEMWVKKHKDSQDKELQAQLRKEEKIKHYNQPRFYPTYSKLEPGDMLLSVEHCFNCHCHNTTLRHKTGEYINNADSHLVSTAKIAHSLNLKVRLGVTRFAADITDKTKESDSNSRVGAFEIQVAYKSASGSVAVEILHSKLSTRRWPSRQVVEKRFRTFAAKHEIPTFYIPEVDRDSVQYGDFETGTRPGDSDYKYPVGAGNWEEVDLGAEPWMFDAAESARYADDLKENTEPSKPRTGQKRTPQMLKARPAAAAHESGPSIATLANLETVHFVYDSRGYVVEAKYQPGEMVAYANAPLFHCPDSGLFEGLGAKSFGSTQVSNPSKYNGFLERRREIFPQRVEIIQCKPNSEKILVKSIYGDPSHRMEIEYSQIEEEDSDMNALIASNQDMNINLEGLLVCAAMVAARVEPTEDGDPGGVEGTHLSWAEMHSSDHGTSRTIQSVYHALRDAAAIVWSKWGAEDSALQGDDSDGTLRHPTRADVRFAPQLAYMPGSLDWCLKNCSDSNGLVNIISLQRAAFGESALEKQSPRVGEPDAPDAPDAPEEQQNAENTGSADMQDPSAGGAVMMSFGEDGSPKFHMDETGSPLKSPSQPASHAPILQEANAKTDTETGKETAAKDTKTTETVESPPPVEEVKSSPRPDSTSPASAAKVDKQSEFLEGEMDPMLAGFLDGLSDGGSPDGSPRSAKVDDDGDDDDDDDDDDDMKFPSMKQYINGGDAGDEGEEGDGSPGGYAEDFFDDI